MEIIHNHSAGIDIGSRNIYVSPGYSEVKVFGAFTCDFKLAACYLLEKGVQTIAMEATGSYWVILYDILTENGFDV